ncbi:MAG: LacI family transcriptional regulator, partial [Herbinix sp.]|nr:LacI family transcriptional regulator [Herbinix sp.]
MKSKRNIILVILILIGIFSLILASTYFYLKEYAGKDKTVKISVIVYGSSSGRWDTLLQGVDQACLNFGSEVNFVSMMSVKDAEEQKILLDREIANGADGIIIAVTDSELMTQEVREASGKIPLVVVETGISDTEGITFVSADNYSMGLNLARSIPMLQSKKTIAVIMENVNRSSINERYQGFLDYI